eukprot:TRINITY_DN343_c0_g4_i1.p1 TRINITY_DN343_c0_g4~~TRINITY_DN343_c0_g4_i1.p1  ORF type:complete len:249 (-),score=66.22 TRINITY_DN343_c0_g4_i1:100-789(-)
MAEMMIYYIAGGLVLVFVLAGLRRVFKRNRGNTVLIFGPVDAGKTALFYQLKQGVFRETHTSMKENVDQFQPALLETKKAELRFVDFPGHGSQFHRFGSYLADLRAAVLVVDSTELSKLADAARMLFSLLTNDKLIKRRCPVFVALNKSDLPSAHASDVVSKQLEKEIEKMRVSQSGLADISAKVDESGVRSLPNEQFKLDASPLPIQFGSISLKKIQIQPLLQFLSKH